MEFKKGDRVVCIDDSGYYNLILNKQYKIVGMIGKDLCEIAGYTQDILSITRFKLDTNYYRKQKIKQLRNGI
jgi:hypothetical protein